MTESLTQSQRNMTVFDPEIPLEIISDEEMALIEAAFLSATATSSSSSLFPPRRLHRNVRKAVTLLSSRKLSRSSGRNRGDMGSGNNGGTVNGSLLHRFRSKRGLSVTDITATVVRKVKVEMKSKEDVWAVKFLNSIVRANQLVFDGLTRELHLKGFMQGVWIIGVIDEIRMPMIEAERFPILADTKIRRQAKLPSEPQQRNGRLQLMCYKYLWDTLVADPFPSSQFFDFFSLDPDSVLSAEKRESTTMLGFHAETLNDLARCYRNTCCKLPPANDQLLLRYELQEDQSLLGEDQFAYDPDWFKNQIKSCLEFWMGDRGARYAPKEEHWKCRFCKFESVCPVTTDGTPNKASEIRRGCK